MRNRNRQPLIPIRHSKEEALLILCCSGHSHILTSHLTAGRAAPERGCNHFLPNKQPSPPSLFLPKVETGLSSRVCSCRLQPQGCVISVRHSQQYGSHGDNPARLIISVGSSAEGKGWKNLRRKVTVREAPVKNLLRLSCSSKVVRLPFRVARSKPRS